MFYYCLPAAASQPTRGPTHCYLQTTWKAGGEMWVWQTEAEQVTLSNENITTNAGYLYNMANSTLYRW